jgi:hypothetical protein
MKSQGLGDTIEKITAATGIKKVVETVSKASGKECGCAARKEKLNDPNLLVNKILYKTQ